MKKIYCLFSCFLVALVCFIPFTTSYADTYYTVDVVNTGTYVDQYFQNTSYGDLSQINFDPVVWCGIVSVTGVKLGSLMCDISCFSPDPYDGVITVRLYFYVNYERGVDSVITFDDNLVSLILTGGVSASNAPIIYLYFSSVDSRFHTLPYFTLYANNSNCFLKNFSGKNYNGVTDGSYFLYNNSSSSSFQIEYTSKSTTYNTYDIIDGLMNSKQSLLRHKYNNGETTEIVYSGNYDRDINDIGNIVDDINNNIVINNNRLNDIYISQNEYFEFIKDYEKDKFNDIVNKFENGEIASEEAAQLISQLPTIDKDLSADVLNRLNNSFNTPRWFESLQFFVAPLTFMEEWYTSVLAYAIGFAAIGYVFSKG